VVTRTSMKQHGGLEADFDPIPTQHKEKIRD